MSRWRWSSAALAALLAGGAPTALATTSLQEAVAGYFAAPITYSTTPSPRTLISLGVRQIDVVDLLKMLAREGGFNLSLDASVRGQATLFVKKVPVWDAFLTVLASRDLAYEHLHGTVHVIPAEAYAAKYGQPFEAAAADADASADGQARPSAADVAMQEVPSEDEAGLSAAYQMEVRRRIQRQVHRLLEQASLPAGETDIFFVLSADGALLEAGRPETFLREDPVKALALQALRDANPFPPFPPSTTLARATFRLTVAAGSTSSRTASNR